MYPVKVAVVGSSGVGKSTIVKQYTTGSLSEGDYVPTTDDSYIVRRNYEEQEYELEINDTGGSEELAPVREVAIGNSEAFLVVYSTASKDSFLDCRKFITTIREIKAGKPLTLLLVGNKIDLEDAKVEVTYVDGEELAKEFEITFFEIMATDVALVESVFSELVRQVELKRVAKVKSAHSVIKKKKQCCLVL